MTNSQDLQDPFSDDLEEINVDFITVIFLLVVNNSPKVFIAWKLIDKCQGSPRTPSKGVMCGEVIGSRFGRQVCSHSRKSRLLVMLRRFQRQKRWHTPYLLRWEDNKLHAKSSFVVDKSSIREI